MEYYAKSKKVQFTSERINEIKKNMKNIEECLKENLTETDVEILNSSITDIAEKTEEKQKTLKEHHKDIVTCAEMFFLEYGEYFTEKEKKLVVEACRIHDLGKVNLVFQAMICPKLAEKFHIDVRKTSQIPHGFLSAVTISLDEFDDLSELFSDKDFGPFITAVYYHHDREDHYNSPAIRKYAEKYYMKQIEEYLNRKIRKLNCSNLDDLLFRNNVYTGKYIPDSNAWKEYLLIKGLLNKFDYTVSAGYENAESAIDLHEKKLVKNIEKFLNGKELRPAQKFMKMNRDKNLIVIAPTGSGKTEASLLWMNGEKSFYTLPLKVSSNAIYLRIKENYEYKDVALLHSDAMAVYLREYNGNEDIGEKYERSKMLSQPLTVCTVDQLFRFVYRALGTEIFAATLKYSKLVLDEIQAYEPRVIATIIYGLKMIQEMGGKFAIITATFPPVLKYFMEQYGLVEGKQYIFKDFTGKEYQVEKYPRHKVEIRHSEMNLDEIRLRGKNRKVLVICNTVSKAQKLYKKLEGENVWLLHSKYIRRDRAFLERKIMGFSESGESGIWITTQIVEASLDIDFDILYTEMCTADSLLQRMGRCNRKGRYCPNEANIVVFDNRNGVSEGKRRSVYEDKLYDRSLELLSKYEHILFSEDKKTAYMNEVYSVDGVKETIYFENIQKDLKLFSEIHPTEYSADEAEVRDIRSVTIVPENVYVENQNLFEYGVEFLKKPNMSREARSLIKSKLENLTLSLNLYQKFPAEVDRTTIGLSENRKITDIHRA
ncbi:CRISPR-associated helicase Cas3' [Blautia wexlerae]|nr:CRISPR-associated helicase Cas3' [Blautia wexlerae]MDB6476176.1 CRISPR-associated helicase Cas3' [Blautia wexlerae]